MANIQHYILIDESGDPGKPFETDATGNKIPTGASLFYILSATYLDSVKLFALENEIMEIRRKYGFRSEIKSTIIPLPMYMDLLAIINKIGIPVYYRLVDKQTYKGKFATAGHAKLHNIFDDYNLSKLVLFTTQKQKLTESEIVIDRADRRMYNGDYFSSFDEYLFERVNTKTIKRIKHITHVNSEYVNAMQLSDLVSEAIKDYFTGKNKDLRKVIDKKYLYKIW
ncbi:MAG: hypothetical protein A3G52_02395 [Candidatus Taylorbacteria bacterium RIFCSPLOWO2_12_FULL_43_20]|uniref:DUF3800 domain-containing protein n=1 Tax=Candidatus Taylorbacteria bacterium RIFCSPLOWO2_12_FULL_43_20 TaxID=1802332 RepID=A0A1G2P2I0_9BACT|nr:MAG: hypothetical protein A3H58_00365 [Candidatus Taylorbacteria bacterium RIFCSPLOWO2_02_FULL_43_22b]OHA42540.1 MAG: hypothetical protein A3G52_02395 [Candidatus Taylorbacteria bacterium RIFCSPLOWO2_12_FULL_43_20]